MTIKKRYSELSFSIDLIIEEYNTTNPIIIAEKAKLDLGLDLSIHAISDYLDINRLDYELESKKQYYQLNY